MPENIYYSKILPSTSISKNNVLALWLSFLKEGPSTHIFQWPLLTKQLLWQEWGADSNVFCKESHLYTLLWNSQESFMNCKADLGDLWFMQEGTLTSVLKG